MATLNLKLEDISSEYRPIAELVGTDGLIRLAERYGGYQLYIPKPESLSRNARDEAIREAFDGYNFNELASQYGLSPRHIRVIVAPVLKRVRAKPIDGQLSFCLPVGEDCDTIKAAESAETDGG
mgnify:FL=1|nr:MAG TPA: Mor transcription activator family [Caudoviricetes sp.]